MSKLVDGKKFHYLVYFFSILMIVFGISLLLFPFSKSGWHPQPKRSDNDSQNKTKRMLYSIPHLTCKNNKASLEIGGKYDI